MNKVYTICMVAGIAIPLLSLILGALGDFMEGFFGIFEGVFDGFDFDFSIELGDVSLCLIPISIQSLCTGALLFGTVGKLMYGSAGLVVTNVTAGILGYVAAVAMQTMIHRLKKVEHTTYDKEQLLLFDAKVVNTIKAGGFGSVSVKTHDGIHTSYPAKAEDKGLEIKQDTIVNIICFEKNVAIVKVKQQ